MIPMATLRYLFNWRDAVEAELIASSELTFGFRPRRSPIFVDLGYGFWVTDHPVEVRKHDVVNSISSFRHGLIVRLGSLALAPQKAEP